jgi:hypothetical protein
VLPEALREAVAWQWQMLAYGIVLVVCVFFLPRGIVPTVTGAARSARTEGGLFKKRRGSDGLFKERRGSDSRE